MSNCNYTCILFLVDMPQEVSVIVALCTLAVVYAGTIPTGDLPKLAPRRPANRQIITTRSHQLPDVQKRNLHMFSEYRLVASSKKWLTIYRCRPCCPYRQLPCVRFTCLSKFFMQLLCARISAFITGTHAAVETLKRQ